MDEEQKKQAEAAQEEPIQEEAASAEVTAAGPAEKTGDTAFALGVTGENYDILPEMEKNTEEEIEEELRGKEAIAISYEFKGDDVREGLKAFQKETIYRKNGIYTAILALVFGVYMVNVVRSPGEVFPMFLAALCVIVVAFLWYLPFNHIRKVAASADENEFAFHMEIYDTCIRVKQENGNFILHFGMDKQISKVIETANLFLICCGKERVFILPKRCLEAGVEEKLRGIFDSAMGEKFVKRIQ